MPNELYSHALAITKKIKDAGHTAYWAGGCVRDKLLDLQPKDIDIGTTAKPDELIGLFPNAITVGKHFGVIVVPMGNINYDVATFRREGEYLDGRHPSEVDFCGPEDDAQRRDFTMNGLFYDPVQEKVIDYVDGVSDIDRHIIRCIGNPDDRFLEDHLRMLRAIRFSSTLNFEIEQDTFAAIRKHATQIRSISPERIQQEFSKILLHAERPGNAIVDLLQSGLLSEIMPEVAAMSGQEQPPQFHPEGDVFTHTVIMLDDMQDHSLELALAVLLHDIGKPATAKLSIEPDGSERIRFNRHAEVGADMAVSILGRLRYPNSTIKTVAHAIGNHMRFKDVMDMRRAKLRRLLGHQFFPLEIELHRLDCRASHGMMGNYEFLQNELNKIESEPVLPPNLINGRDIMDLGIEEGPEIGKILRMSYDHQLEGGADISKEELLEWTKDMVNKFVG